MRAVGFVTGGLVAAILATVAAHEACAQSAGATIALGEPIAARIGDDAPRLGQVPFLVFRFDAVAGDRYLVTAHAEGFSPYLRVGRNVAGITDYLLIGGNHGLGTTAAHLFVPEESGEYVVVVHGEEGGTGDFTLAIDPARPATESLTLGEPAVGALESTAVHRFPGVVGQEVVITARSSEFDTVLEVGTIDEAGDFIPVASDDDGAGGTDSRLYFTPPASGEYALRVREYAAGEGGGYAVLVAPEPARAAPTPMEPGVHAGGALTVASPRDDEGWPFAEWTLPGEVGTRYRIDLWSNDFDTRLAAGRLDGSRFVETATNDDASSSDLGPTDSRLIVRGEGRPIVLRVHAWSVDERGEYTLLATPLPDPIMTAVVTPTTIGASVTGELTHTDALLPSGESYREYVFPASAGRRVDIALTSDDFDTYLEVGIGTGDALARLASNDDGYGNPNTTDSRLVFTAPATSDYTIRVRPWAAGETGRYALILTEPPPPPATRRIAVDGVAVRDLITDADPRLDGGPPFHGWTFEARTGESFAIELTSADFDAVLHVGRFVNGQFVELASNDDFAGGTDARVDFTARESGEYVIRARPYSDGAAGYYSLTVRREP